MHTFPLTVGRVKPPETGWHQQQQCVIYSLTVLEPGGHSQGVLGWSVLHCPLSSQKTSSLHYLCLCPICPYRVVLKLNWAPPMTTFILVASKNPVPSMVTLMGMSRWGLYILLMGHNSVPHIDLPLGAQIQGKLARLQH